MGKDFFNLINNVATIVQGASIISENITHGEGSHGTGAILSRTGCGNNSTFKVSNTKITGNNNTIVGNNNHVVGNNNDIIGDYNHVVGNNNDCVGIGNSGIGANNDFSETKSKNKINRDVNIGSVVDKSKATKTWTQGGVIEHKKPKRKWGLDKFNISDDIYKEVEDFMKEYDEFEYLNNSSSK